MAEEPPELITELDTDIHTWFGLSYANFLVLARSHLQSMPLEFQHMFVGLLEIMQEAYPHFREPQYFVSEKDPETHKFVKSTIPPYNRGRTFIPPELTVQQIRERIAAVVGSMPDTRSAEEIAAEQIAVIEQAGETIAAARRAWPRWLGGRGDS